MSGKSEPPLWLVESVDRLQSRLDRLWSRLRGEPATQDDQDLTEEERLEHSRDEAAAFERKWGVYYKPLVLLVVLWLILMAVWERL
jgi:hypothetical protein